MLAPLSFRLALRQTGSEILQRVFLQLLSVSLLPINLQHLHISVSTLVIGPGHTLIEAILDLALPSFVR